MQTVHYRAVVFDLDGTAVDSRYNIDALQMTCQEMLGRSATDEELKLTMNDRCQRYALPRRCRRPNRTVCPALGAEHHGTVPERLPL